MISKNYFDKAGLGSILDKVLAGERISTEDGMTLFNCPDLNALGALASIRRRQLHGNKTYYVINRHINYTNICVNGCLFCAYARKPEEKGAFKLSREEILEKLEKAPIPPREVHVVGGCHHDIPLSFFEETFVEIKKLLPQASIKSFTAVEIAHFATSEGISTVEVLKRLKEAGAEMLTGGGAEIFNPDVRAKICPGKLPGKEWLRIHGEAHELGYSTNCTMLYGHVESFADRVDHLDQLRRQQDKTGGFSCLIPLPFLTENSRLKIDNPLTGVDELRNIAVCRLMLDNIPHIKSYWVMLGVKQAQTALHFGADDFDGTVVEEKIGHMAGAESEQGLSRTELKEMISGCGFTPVERDAAFNEI
ncbi:aminofutalosine synthase MqnE [Maridesulfovibrio sp.]|jgi:aminodeoxyfutalosine synthase|uniref:aminofutalosine synthase MqnE n=1 Tax=Maridesulfovibrio sp. TaxID=2795000 RepID=UPI0029CAA355|nr:aminofutalosine synthase MqnE [Maridesulfovibrio sp.]